MRIRPAQRRPPPPSKKQRSRAQARSRSRTSRQKPQRRAARARAGYRIRMPRCAPRQPLHPDFERGSVYLSGKISRYARPFARARVTARLPEPCSTARSRNPRRPTAPYGVPISWCKTKRCAGCVGATPEQPERVARRREELGAPAHRRALAECRGNQRRAAELLGLSRGALNSARSTRRAPFGHEDHVPRSRTLAGSHAQHVDFEARKFEPPLITRARPG